MSQRDSMNFDVLIVGAGPAGLSAAIRLAELGQKQETPYNIAVLEKGAHVGAHLLSGAIFDPIALHSLCPNWQELDAPIGTTVQEDRFYALSAKKAWRLPTPRSLNNQGNYILSIGALCDWLKTQAENLGVSIFTGFTANEILYNSDKTQVIGVATGDLGVNAQNEPGPRHMPGIELHAKQTLFAEGCRGFLSQQLMQHFELRNHCDPQTYGIGLKEVWQIDPCQHQAGLVIHTNGWPLDKKTYGGSFLYHYGKDQIALGLIIGLDYRNPYLDPFMELQRLKHHPFFAKTLAGGRCIAYGARAVNEGGWQSLPKLSFPGGCLLGCSAGTLNVARLKGNHAAMQSGILAADSLHESLDALCGENLAYEKALRSSWLGTELKQARNIRPSFNRGYWQGMLYSAIDQWVFAGKAPWTFRNHVDHLSLKPAKYAKPINYPKPDGKLSFRKLDQVFLSGTQHEEDQPCHLKLKDAAIEQSVNIARFHAPETRYCPAGVYELVEDNEGNKQLQINFANCLHCKTCDIKDPTQNIIWTPPEGGGGPNYQNM